RPSARGPRQRRTPPRNRGLLAGYFTSRNLQRIGVAPSGGVREIPGVLQRSRFDGLRRQPVTLHFPLNGGLLERQRAGGKGGDDRQEPHARVLHGDSLPVPVTSPPRRMTIRGGGGMIGPDRCKDDAGPESRRLRPSPDSFRAVPHTA